MDKNKDWRHLGAQRYWILVDSETKDIRLFFHTFWSDFLKRELARWLAMIMARCARFGRTRSHGTENPLVPMTKPL